MSDRVYLNHISDQSFNIEDIFYLKKKKDNFGTAIVLYRGCHVLITRSY